MSIATVLRRWLERLMETVTIAILVSLAVIVVMAVIFRKAGNSLVWYDEVASVLLAWLTYLGAVLAALRRAHLGFPGLFFAFPVQFRAVFLVVAESLIIGFFLVLAYAGWFVLEIMEGETLISVPWLDLSVTQSVIPIAAVLFIFAEVISLPETWVKVKAGIDAETEEIEKAIEDAEKEWERTQ